MRVGRSVRPRFALSEFNMPRLDLSVAEQAADEPQREDPEVRGLGRGVEAEAADHVGLVGPLRLGAGIDLRVGSLDTQSTETRAAKALHTKQETGLLQSAARRVAEGGQPMSTGAAAATKAHRASKSASSSNHPRLSA